ncbi:hypothetical protein [Prevotella sp. 10(H)]|uniref:hypothetical protein n=1 Tax=Prevotella sp. 10(H) TaxID=1158294 RepID=UPI000AFA2CD8|nr:hypothetical protein [Prevotella sp. 10(H)]
MKQTFIYLIIRLLEELELEWTLNPSKYRSYIGHGHSDKRLEIDSYEFHGCY